MWTSALGGGKCLHNAWPYHMTRPVRQLVFAICAWVTNVSPDIFVSIPHVCMILINEDTERAVEVCSKPTYLLPSDYDEVRERAASLLFCQLVASPEPTVIFIVGSKSRVKRETNKMETCEAPQCRFCLECSLPSVSSWGFAGHVWASLCMCGC